MSSGDTEQFDDHPPTQLDAEQTYRMTAYSTSAIVSDPLLSETQHERIDKFREIVVAILQEHKCYDLIPLSGKVVVFDSHLSLKHAFRALVEHDIKCAPVWSTEDSEFVGLMTVTDFANILVASVYEDSNDVSEADVTADWERKADDLESRTVGTWALFRKTHGTSPTRARFISVTAESSMYEAVTLLHKNFIHRMPVRCVDGGKSIVCIINYQKIMRFILQKIDHERGRIDMRVSDLGLKFEQHIPTISQTATLLATLRILSQNRKLTAVPIVNESGIFEDAFLRGDVRFLAVNYAYKKHEISVREFLDTHSKSRSVVCCKLEDSVIEVLFEMLRKRNHISIILDDNSRVIGMLTLRDVMSLILGPSYAPTAAAQSKSKVELLSSESLGDILRNTDVAHEYMVIDSRERARSHQIRGAMRFAGREQSLVNLIQNEIVSSSKNIVFCCDETDENNPAESYSRMRNEQKFEHLPPQRVFLLSGGFVSFFELFQETDLIVAPQ